MGWRWTGRSESQLASPVRKTRRLHARRSPPLFELSDMNQLKGPSREVERDRAEPRPACPSAATLLAAGLGQRLGGRAKSALRIGNSSLLERLVAALRDAGVSAVNVVIGPYQDQLLPLIERSGAQPVIHQQPSPSLVDSQRLALHAHASSFPTCDLLLVLADLPMLNAADVLHLLTHWSRRAPGVHALMPVVDGVRGHPLLLSSQAVLAVNGTPRHLGVRDWLSAHPDAAWPLPCSRRAYVTDLDTSEDLVKLQALMFPTAVSW